jgi:hypothetical protein
MENDEMPTLIAYLFLAVLLTAMSVRSSLQENQKQQQQAVRDENQEKRERKLTSAQDALNAEQQVFSLQQTAMARDLGRLAEFEKSANASANVAGRITNIKSPSVQLANVSSVTARTIDWETVLWNLDQPSDEPYPIPTQSVEFMKGKSTALPMSIFINRGVPFPKDGDRIFGYLYVDCANCETSHFYWLYFHYGVSGWMAPIPTGSPINLQFILKNLESFKKEPDDNWLNQFALSGIRQAIGNNSDGPF